MARAAAPHCWRFTLAGLNGGAPARADFFYKGKTFTCGRLLAAAAMTSMARGTLARHLSRPHPATASSTSVQNIPCAGSLTIGALSRRTAPKDAAPP